MTREKKKNGWGDQNGQRNVEIYFKRYDDIFCWNKLHLRRSRRRIGAEEEAQVAAEEENSLDGAST